MAIALVTGTPTTAGGGSGGTTSAIDTTGGNLLIACVASYVSVADATVSDSKSNTWTSLTKRTTTVQYVQIFYAKNATVGSGHTFTVSGSGSFSSIAVAAFSGADTTAPFDQQNGSTNNGTATAIACGSVTPGQDGELLIAMLGLNTSSTTPTIDVSFASPATAYKNYVSSTNFGVGLSYQIQATATARNPTWTFQSASPIAAAIATFKAVAAGASFVKGYQVRQAVNRAATY